MECTWQRCNKAAIPESERVFKTKNQLALEIVEQGPPQWSAIWLGWSRCGLWQWSGLSLSVQQFVQGCPTKHWRVYNVRETTRGSLKLRVLRKSVYVWTSTAAKDAATNCWSLRAWMDK